MKNMYNQYGVEQLEMEDYYGAIRFTATWDCD